jgi:rRNA processing protein Krr1/Pno1
MTPLKAQWPRIYPPLVEHLKLQVRMNVKRKAVELRTSRHTTDAEAIQRGVDFLSAFVCGFDVDDAIALLRLDDLYIGMLTVAGSGGYSTGNTSPFCRGCLTSAVCATRD